MSDLVIEPKPRIKAKISAAEMQQRREALLQADAHNRIEGQFCSAEANAVFEAFICGDIEEDEIIPSLDVLYRRV